MPSCVTCGESANVITSRQPPPTLQVIGLRPGACSYIWYLETSLSSNLIVDTMIDADAHTAIRALASDKRLLILAWLKAPRRHFPPQSYGDLVDDGVCGVFIAAKLGVSQPT